MKKKGQKQIEFSKIGQKNKRIGNNGQQWAKSLKKKRERDDNSFLKGKGLENNPVQKYKELKFMNKKVKNGQLHVWIKKQSNWLKQLQNIYRMKIPNQETL